MERGVNVNDWPANDGDAGSQELFPVESPVATAQDLGPCLYLGPAGQRCSRRAVRDGLCAIHQRGQTPAAVRLPGAKRSRLAAAIIGILGVLWPLVADLIHEITRWLHSH
jgi:hypothetical protein